MILKETTDDFCECFASKKDCTGIMARLMASTELPDGVDPNDERVKQVIKWCQENSEPDANMSDGDPQDYGDK